MSKSSRKETRSRRRDIRIPYKLDEQIKRIAVEHFDAHIHHISKEPEVTPTILELIKVGIAHLETPLSDEHADTLSDLESLKDFIKQEVSTLEERVAARLIALIAERLAGERSSLISSSKEPAAAAVAND